jgi:predicted HNH restriction endonuclease
MPIEEAKELRVIRAEGIVPPKLDHRGLLDRQTFRNTCEITPESAALLDKYVSQAIEEFRDKVGSDIEAQEFEEETRSEGAPKDVLVRRYERDPSLRARAIEYHGTVCQTCGFDFYEVYGDRGKDYIEVHHKVPLSTYGEGRDVVPETDMAVLCANCHRMIHRNAAKPLTVEDLAEIVDEQLRLMGLGDDDEE